MKFQGLIYQKRQVLPLLVIATMAAPLFAQDSKAKVRLSVGYSALMPDASFLNITAKYRGEEGIEPAGGLEFQISYLPKADSLVPIGKAKSDATGMAIFQLAGLDSAMADSSGVYHFQVRALESPEFQEADRDIEFKRARLSTSITSDRDSHTLNATLIDEKTGDPLAEMPLRVQVRRLFRPLRIGDEFYMTDDEGMVSVDIPPGIPGLDGNLTLEALLSDNDEYGTVKAVVEAPIGSPIEDQSTFDERTMWSPPSKTPLFLLIFPNLLILGIWGTILYLIMNLFKIYKSKN